MDTVLPLDIYYTTRGTISDNKTDSGLMIFKIIDGQLMHKDCYVEVLMDDMLYPAYATTRLKTKNVKIDESKFIF